MQIALSRWLPLTTLLVLALQVSLRAQLTSGSIAGRVVDETGGAARRHGDAPRRADRDEALNANSFFNNKNDVEKPIYRYDTRGFTLGGPVAVPGWFNKERRKLFFFYSFENAHTEIPKTSGKSPRQLSASGGATSLRRTTSTATPGTCHVRAVCGTMWRSGRCSTTGRSRALPRLRVERRPV